tara:strand:+ start:567 stop:773 length:207 start_codon:yes stop_codon:yes gene_type:complete
MSNENKSISEIVRKLENDYTTIKEHYRTLLSQYANLIKKYDRAEYDQLEKLKESYEEVTKAKLKLKKD